MKQKNNRGFSLIEMVVVISIAVILLGIIAPSLNSILGYDAQKATQSLCDTLSETKMEAMSRLVGEVKLSYENGDYYATLYLDRGNGRGLEGSQPERIARGRVRIRYTDSAAKSYDLKETPLILTFDREREGAFREIQSDTVKQDELKEFLENESDYRDLRFYDSGVYCESITVSCGMRTRVITLDRAAGSYTVKAG